MSIEINYKKLSELSIADLKALHDFYQMEHFETEDIEYEKICVEICDSLANQIRERRMNIYIF
jgi:hypothetical protein